MNKISSFLKDVDIYDIFDYLDIEIIMKGKGDEIIAVCPICEDNNKHFYFNSVNGKCLCFKCGFSGSLITLLRKVTGWCNDEIGRFLNNFGNYDYSEVTIDFIDSRINKVFVDETFDNISCVNLPYECINVGNGIGWKYLEGRRVTRESIKQFGIKYCRIGKYKDRIIIPILDLEGNKLSFIARSVKKILCEGEKKVIYAEGVKVSRTVFNYNNTSSKSIPYVVEGVYDTINLVQMGISSVSLLGNKISDFQVGALVRKFDSVVICFDGDEKGWEGAKKVGIKLCNFIDVKILSLSHNTDPGDLLDCNILKRYDDFIIEDNFENKIIEDLKSVFTVS